MSVRHSSPHPRHHGFITSALVLIALVVAIVLGTPANALAADASFSGLTFSYDGGDASQVVSESTSDKTITINAPSEGTISIKGSSSDVRSIKVAATNKADLKLAGVTMTQPIDAKVPLFDIDAPDLTLTITDTNNLTAAGDKVTGGSGNIATATSQSAIDAVGNLTIQGVGEDTGSLTLISAFEGYKSAQEGQKRPPMPLGLLSAGKTLSITSGTIHSTSFNADQDAIAGYAVKISGGDVTGEILKAGFGGGIAIHARGNSINDKGNNIEITGGKVTALADGSGALYQQACMAMSAGYGGNAESKIVIDSKDGKTPTVKATTTASSATVNRLNYGVAMNAGAIEIHAGDVTAEVVYGADHVSALVAGTITVDGGTLNATTSGNGFPIEGGAVTFANGTGMEGEGPTVTLNNKGNNRAFGCNPRFIASTYGEDDFFPWFVQGANAKPENGRESELPILTFAGASNAPLATGADGRVYSERSFNEKYIEIRPNEIEGLTFEKIETDIQAAPGKAIGLKTKLTFEDHSQLEGTNANTFVPLVGGTAVPEENGRFVDIKNGFATCIVSSDASGSKTDVTPALDSASPFTTIYKNSEVLEPLEFQMSYPVTFLAAGGKFGTDDSLVKMTDSSGVVAKPDDPVRKGYVFLGWTLDGSTSIIDNLTSMTFATATTLTAQWAKPGLVFTPSSQTASGGTNVTYTLRYILTPEIAGVKTPETYATPEKEEFELNAESNVEVATPTIQKNSDGSFTVSVMAPSNESSTNSIDITVKVTLKDTDKTSKLTASAALIVNPANKLVATFDPNGGKIDGSLKGKDVECSVSDGSASVNRPTNPTRDGFEFLGWYTDSSWAFESSVSEAITANTTFTAQWGTRSLVVSPTELKIDGGDSNTSSAYKATATLTASDATVGLPDNSSLESIDISVSPDEVSQGTTINGAATSPVTSSSLSQQSISKEFTVTASGDSRVIPITATWHDLSAHASLIVADPPTCTITFKANGGSWGTSESSNVDSLSQVVEVHSNADESVKKPEDPKRDGMLFLGWYEQSGANWNHITFEDGTYSFNAEKGETREFTALWAKPSITLTPKQSNVNPGEKVQIIAEVSIETDPAGVSYLGGDLNDRPIDIETNPKLEITIGEPEAAKQLFEFTAPNDGTDTETLIVVTARWEGCESKATVIVAPVEYTATFLTNGGTFDNGKTSKTAPADRANGFDIGSVRDLNSPDDSYEQPKREGYVFLGWYEKSETTPKSETATVWNHVNFQEPVILNQPRTFTAQWGEPSITLELPTWETTPKGVVTLRAKLVVMPEVEGVKPPDGHSLEEANNGVKLTIGGNTITPKGKLSNAKDNMSADVEYQIEAPSITGLFQISANWETYANSSTNLVVVKKVPSDPTAKTCTITLDGGGGKWADGSKTQTLSVLSGTPLDGLIPSGLDYTGNALLGWYESSGFGSLTPVKVSEYVITDNIYLTAQWGSEKESALIVEPSIIYAKPGETVSYTAILTFRPENAGIQPSIDPNWEGNRTTPTSSNFNFNAGTLDRTVELTGDGVSKDDVKVSFSDIRDKNGTTLPAAKLITVKAPDSASNVTIKLTYTPQAATAMTGESEENPDKIEDQYYVAIASLIVEDNPNIEAPPSSSSPSPSTTCTVTFDGNGGTWPDGSSTKQANVAPGATATVPEGLANGDLVLAGWQLKATDGILTPVDLTTYQVTSDVTFVAQWEEPGNPAEPTDDVVAVHRLYNPYDGTHLLTTDTTEVASLASIGWSDEGVKLHQYGTAADGRVPVTRLYNPYNGDHIYTAKDSEVATLANEVGWVDEGVKFYGAPEADGAPVWRLWNRYMQANGGLGSHLWTTDPNEVERLVAIDPDGWLNEDIYWRAVGGPIAAAEGEASEIG